MNRTPSSYEGPRVGHLFRLGRPLSLSRNRPFLAPVRCAGLLSGLFRVAPRPPL